jgi:hypothetical protein
MKTDIKIQSISDIITNSSTEVFTVYSRSDLNTVKDIVNAILAIDGKYTFDDLFTIHMSIDDYAIEDLYNDNESLQERFHDSDELYDLLINADPEVVEEFEDMYADQFYNRYYYHRTFYNGYYVRLKEGVENSEVMMAARNAINRFDCIFDHDYSEC